MAAASAAPPYLCVSAFPPSRPSCPPNFIQSRSNDFFLTSCTVAYRIIPVRVIIADSSDRAQDSVDNFVQRMEKAWLISKQPKPIPCTTCKTEGCIECLWCKATGFFILGDSMLCEVPSRNTACYICLGLGSVPCKDCKGTGYRARWLGNPT